MPEIVLVILFAIEPHPANIGSVGSIAGRGDNDMVAVLKRYICFLKQRTADSISPAPGATG